MANDYTKIALQLQKYGTVQGLMKYINKESLIEQDEKQEKGKAVGIDRVTKEEYDENLEENIDDLIERMKRFAYRPKSTRRVYIPKEGSTKQRPISIPAYEDKLVQGVMEGLTKYETDKGTPQGGLISPILANIYLHYVLDLWFKIEIQRNCTGGAYIVRYADDFVCCFEKEEEAKEFFEKLKERLAKFRTRNSRRKEQDNKIRKEVKWK